MPAKKKAARNKSKKTGPSLKKHTYVRGDTKPGKSAGTQWVESSSSSCSTSTGWSETEYRPVRKTTTKKFKGRGSK